MVSNRVGLGAAIPLHSILSLTAERMGDTNLQLVLLYTNIKHVPR
jgi:hypothetical protein